MRDRSRPFHCSPPRPPHDVRGILDASRAARRARAVRSLVGKLGPTCTCIGDENCTAAPPMPRGTCAVEPWDREGDVKLNALAGAAREPDKRCACITASRATPGTDDAANCAALE